MKKQPLLLTLLFILIAVQSAVSQCELNPFAFIDCETASAQVPLCPQDGAAHNISWIAFEAPAGAFGLELIPFQCLGSTSGNEGVQVGVYTDCSFQEAVFCDPNCNLGPTAIPTDDMQAGEVYYLFIDGCNDSYCQYELVFETESLTADPCISTTELIASTETDCNLPIIAFSDSAFFDESCLVQFTQCDFTGPTTWHNIAIDDPSAEKLVTQVLTDSVDVVWSIYCGSNPLTATRVQGVNHQTGGIYSCSSSDGDADNIHVVPLDNAGQETYWLVVTAASDITDPNYVVNYYTTVECPSCTASSNTNFGSGDIKAFVDGVESDGPFCPGQTVEVCVDYFYDATTSGNDWLHGIIPVFGDGWEVDESVLEDLQTMPSAEWFSSESSCAPRVNGYNVPNICTYREDGVLKMKSLLESPSTDCSGLLLDGSPLPSGWFSTSAGNNMTCGQDCSPASFYGITGGVTVAVEFCISLTVKGLDAECDLPRSLQVQLFPTSDGITGCWDDPEPCLQLIPVVSPPWRASCDSASVSLIEAEDMTICSGSTVDEVISISGDATQITVSYIDNPAVLGEGSSSGWGSLGVLLLGQQGVIGDQLVNTSDEPQVVTYRLVPSGVGGCYLGSTVLEVTVVPEIDIELDDTYSTCQGSCVTVVPVVSNSDSSTYTWSTGEIGESVTVCPPLTTSYFLTVSDAFGCSSEASFDVIVDDQFAVTIDTTICEGADYLGFSTAGQYEVVRPGEMACDTVVTINLATEALTTSTAEFTICEGDVVTIDGQTLSEAGEYPFVYVTSDQCDSVALVTIIEVPTPILQSGMDMLCEGEETQILTGSNVSITSATPTICGVNASGVVTAFAAGTCIVLGIDASGCSGVLSLPILSSADPDCWLSGTESLTASSSVCPNPVSHTLTVTSDHLITQITLIATDGRRQVAPVSTGTSQLVDVSHYAPGLYLVQVHTSAGLSAHKVLVVE